LWRFDKTISEFLAYFHCACAETPTYELLAYFASGQKSDLAIRFGDADFL